MTSTVSSDIVSFQRGGHSNPRKQNHNDNCCQLSLSEKPRILNSKSTRSALFIRYFISVRPQIYNNYTWQMMRLSASDRQCF